MSPRKYEEKRQRPGKCCAKKVDEGMGWNCGTHSEPIGAFGAEPQALELEAETGLARTILLVVHTLLVAFLERNEEISVSSGIEEGPWERKRSTCLATDSASVAARLRADCALWLADAVRLFRSRRLGCRWHDDGV